jgi:glycosyltransferase involved in cell wall biosynthesis
MKKIKLLFFLDSLCAGGKERRFMQLLQYLKERNDFQIQVVLIDNIIHYRDVLNFNIPILFVERKISKKDPLVFFKFHKIVQKFKPDLIHVWGGMTCFYAIPTSLFLNIPLLNSQIADATILENRSIFFKLLWSINRNYSKKLFSNSIAGLKAYHVNDDKGIVIYNGIYLDRFKNLVQKSEIKKKYKIKTKFSVVMVAKFGRNKDYNLFLDVAKKVSEKRNDVTFIAVGDGVTKNKIEGYAQIGNINNLIFTGNIRNVEDVVNYCDIGVLFTDMRYHNEGIPNAVMEYMALSKPVIATDSGGTSELVLETVSGFLVDRDIDLIAENIIQLLDNPSLRKQMGINGRVIIENKFTISKMGAEFVKQYKELSEKLLSK